MRGLVAGDSVTRPAAATTRPPEREGEWMAAAAKQKSVRASSEEAGRVEAGLSHLEVSLNAAQEAAKALRRDVNRGTRDLASNVETMLAATRKDTGKLARAVRRDLADRQKAMTSPPAATSSRPARLPLTKRSSTAARRSGASASKRPASS